jgi:hypothetical protein
MIEAAVVDASGAIKWVIGEAAAKLAGSQPLPPSAGCRSC